MVLTEGEHLEGAGGWDGERKEGGMADAGCLLTELKMVVAPTDIENVVFAEDRCG
jgi:hypothetical protein